MAKLDRGVRAGDHNTEQRGATLPDGIYELEVETTEVKKSAKGGSYINVTYEVFLPEAFKGRKIFEIINTKVPGSAKAEQIGEETLAKLIKACGIADDVEVEDTEDLHAKPFLARVGLEKLQEGDTNQPKNKIWRFYYPEDEQPIPRVEEKKPERSRERPGTESRERSREPDRSRDREPDRSREREPERSRGERERPAERSREREPDRGRGRDDHNEGDDADRREMENAADEGARSVERGNRGGDGSDNPWAGRERGSRR